MPWQPSISMANIYKTAALNVNGISSGMRMRMFEEFLQNERLTLSSYKRLLRGY
jgi:hypothetical protein